MVIIGGELFTENPAVILQLVPYRETSEVGVGHIVEHSVQYHSITVGEVF